MITACGACGLVLEAESEGTDGVLVCPRCANVISGRSNMLYSFVSGISALILMLPAMMYPFLSIQMGETKLSVTLFESVAALNADGYIPAGIAVFMTSFLVPLLYLLLISYVSFDTVSGVRMPFSQPLAHFIHKLHAWHMVDVFLVGILVSVVKLVDMADVELGIGFYLLAVISVLLITAENYYDSKHFWRSRQ